MSHFPQLFVCVVLLVLAPICTFAASHLPFSVWFYDQQVENLTTTDGSWTSWVNFVSPGASGVTKSNVSYVDDVPYDLLPPIRNPDFQFFSVRGARFSVSANGFLSLSHLPLCDHFCAFLPGSYKPVPISNNGQKLLQGDWPLIGGYVDDLWPANTCEDENSGVFHTSRNIDGQESLLVEWHRIQTFSEIVQMLDPSKEQIWDPSQTSTVQIEILGNGTIFVRYDELPSADYLQTLLGSDHTPPYAGLVYTPRQSSHLKGPPQSKTVVRFEPRVDACGARTSMSACLEECGTCLWCRNLQFCVAESVAADFCSGHAQRRCIGDPAVIQADLLGNTALTCDVPLPLRRPAGATQPSSEKHCVALGGCWTNGSLNGLVANKRCYLPSELYYAQDVEYGKASEWDDIRHEQSTFSTFDTDLPNGWLVVHQSNFSFPFFGSGYGPPPPEPPTETPDPPETETLTLTFNGLKAGGYVTSNTGSFKLPPLPVQPLFEQRVASRFGISRQGFISLSSLKTVSTMKNSIEEMMECIASDNRDLSCNTSDIIALFTAHLQIVSSGTHEQQFAARQNAVTYRWNHDRNNVATSLLIQWTKVVRNGGWPHMSDIEEQFTGTLSSKRKIIDYPAKDQSFSMQAELFTTGVIKIRFILDACSYPVNSSVTSSFQLSGEHAGEKWRNRVDFRSSVACGGTEPNTRGSPSPVLPNYVYGLRADSLSGLIGGQYAVSGSMFHWSLIRHGVQFTFTPLTGCPNDCTDPYVARCNRVWPSEPNPPVPPRPWFNRDESDPTTSCQCKPNFGSPDCSVCAPSHFEADCKPCPRCVQGRCNETRQGNGVCICDSPAWSGLLCNVSCSNVPKTRCDPPCHTVWGTTAPMATLKAGGYCACGKCECTPDWTGPDCSIPKVDCASPALDDCTTCTAAGNGKGCVYCTTTQGLACVPDLHISRCSQRMEMHYNPKTCLPPDKVLRFPRVSVDDRPSERLALVSVWMLGVVTALAFVALCCWRCSLVLFKRHRDVSNLEVSCESLLPKNIASSDSLLPSLPVLAASAIPSTIGGHTGNVTEDDGYQHPHETPNLTPNDISDGSDGEWRNDAGSHDQLETDE